MLNGIVVARINSNLTSDADLTRAVPLKENKELWAYGSQQKASFDISLEEARKLVRQPNASGIPNTLVVRPSLNGAQVLGRKPPTYVIDFGTESDMSAAASFEAPFERVRREIFPIRKEHREKCQRVYWWLHARPSPKYRAFMSQRRYLVTPVVSKHRVFVWLDNRVLVDHATVVFGRTDDYWFGVLQCALHDQWARGLGTQVREAESGFRYTPSTTFETFPMPWAPGKENARSAAYARISEAAKTLNAQRERWLNPPEWIEPLAAGIDAADDFADVPAEARALIRHSAIMAAAAADARLKKRTLTNLYNERPTWLKLAHQALDAAVLAAYAETDPEGEWEEGWAEVWVDSGAGQGLAEGHALKGRREEVDRRVLENLLRLNLARAERSRKRKE